MVTHNPELAERYSPPASSRLLDGSVVDDTQPCTADEPQAPRPARTGRTSMCIPDGAVAVSLHNLMTKKARTILIAFAGSIGIIGIALILSLSSGVQSLDRPHGARDALVLSPDDPEKHRGLFVHDEHAGRC